jgi:hypothetical protein
MEHDISQTIGFICSTCGQFHEGVPMVWAADQPYYTFEIPQEERETRVELTEDLCILDGQHFFIRGLLEIPVVDGAGPFAWEVWSSLSRQNFERTVELWKAEGREHEPPYFGWLSTSLPGYPETLNMKTNVHTRPVGVRPFIELEPTDHPLAVEQRVGITMARVQQIAEQMLHA